MDRAGEPLINGKNDAAWRRRPIRACAKRDIQRIYHKVALHSGANLVPYQAYSVVWMGKIVPMGHKVSRLLARV